MIVDNEKINLLRLVRSHGIGVKTANFLLKKYHTPSQVIKYAAKDYQFADLKIIEQEIENHEKLGCELIAFTEDAYPISLKNIPDYPLILSVRGNKALLHQQSIAIVGSRNASFHGIRFAKKLAEDLSRHDLVVVSGMARGIDDSAHKGALPNPTIAVLAGGVDYIYPPQHKKLYEDIVTHGLVLSEMPLGTFAGARLFPKRNRLIAGLSQGICIIEAMKPSGSLITAHFGGEQGREIFAVPHFPQDGQSNGTNDLIRQGAHILENYHDVLNVLGWEKKIIEDKETRVGEALEKPEYYEGLLKKMLCHGPVDLEDILNAMPQSQNLPHFLGQLEIEGKIKRNHLGQMMWVL